MPLARQSTDSGSLGLGAARTLRAGAYFSPVALHSWPTAPESRLKRSRNSASLMSANSVSPSEYDACPARTRELCSNTSCALVAKWPSLRLYSSLLSNRRPCASAHSRNAASSSACVPSAIACASASVGTTSAAGSSERTAALAASYCERAHDAVPSAPANAATVHSVDATAIQLRVSRRGSVGVLRAGAETLERGHARARQAPPRPSRERASVRFRSSSSSSSRPRVAGANAKLARGTGQEEPSRARRAEREAGWGARARRPESALTGTGSARTS